MMSDARAVTGVRHAQRCQDDEDQRVPTRRRPLEMTIAWTCGEFFKPASQVQRLLNMA
jgi:hypothetical protein